MLFYVIWFRKTFWGQLRDTGAEKNPPCEERRMVYLAERPTRAKVLWQESAWRVVSREESGLWERWRNNIGQDLQGLKIWGFIPVLMGSH